MQLLGKMFETLFKPKPIVKEVTKDHEKHHEVMSAIINSILSTIDKAEEEVIIRESKFREEIESNKLFTYVLDNLPIMVWAKDLQGNFNIANKAMREKLLLATCAEEVYGNNGTYFAKRARMLHPLIEDYYTFGEVCDNSELVVLEKQKTGDNGPHTFLEWGNVAGEFLALEVIKAPLYDIEGNLIGTIGSGIEVTEKVLYYKDIISSFEQSTCRGNNPYCNPILVKAKKYFETYHFTGSNSVKL
jgi:PAS domain-containing protein